MDEKSLAALRAAGFTRISLGMQSAAPHVLAVLDRVHEPGRPARCAEWAREAGFEHVSLDLIYGTPGETDADWRESLEAALAAGPDHISAYALIVEEGTRLAAQIRRGEVAVPDDEAMADRYLAADELLSARGTGLVRGVQLGRRAGGPLPAQPPVLDGRPLVGGGTGRAQPRGRGPVVEREAPGRLRGPAHRRDQPGPGPGGAHRAGAQAGGDHAADPAGLRLPGRAARPGRAGRPRAPRSRTGWPSRTPTPRAGSC